MDETKGKLPLGLCKQAFMKLEAFLIDINEIREDPDISEDEKYQFQQMAEIAGDMMAAMINIVSSEMGEEEFVAETINMDEIDAYPEGDLLEEPVE